MGRRKSDDKLIEGMEHLVKDMEYIMIPVDIFGSKYYIPATKREGDQYYRISSEALTYVYSKIQNHYQTIHIELIPNPTVMEMNHCVVLCRLKMESDGIETYSDIRVGEVRVTPDSNDFERMTPYVSAYRKAQNKCIYMDVLKLPSRYFDSEGRPVVYFDDPVEAERTEETDAAFEEPVLPEQNAEPEPALNSVEEAELEELSKFTIKTRNRDVEKIRTLSEMSPALLDWFAENSTDAEILEKVTRYLELCHKRDGVSMEAA